MRKRMKRCIAALLAAALVCSLGFSVEAVAKGHLYHLRKGMFDSEDSDW